MRTTIYIDGFNLYYRALRNSPYKWLNLEAMSRHLLRPTSTITCIKYFTARVTARPNDLDQPVRQDSYLRALATLHCITIIFGTFLTNTVSMRLANPQPGGPYYASVIKQKKRGQM